MKSYIKIYGPPIAEAIKALETIGVNTDEVCIWDTKIETTVQFPSPDALFSSTEEEAMVTEAQERTLFDSVTEIPEHRCGKIVSKSGEKVGEYDFYFDWIKDPTHEELFSLIEKIDEALAPLGCQYTITTK